MAHLPCDFIDLHNTPNSLTMKKIITLLSLISICCFAAATSPLGDMLKKLASFPVEQLIPDQIVRSIIDQTIERSMTNNEIEFRSCYFEAREQTYSQEILFNNFKNPESSAYWFDPVKTMIITKVKNHLHQGQNLRQMYKTHSEYFADKVRGLPAENKVRVQNKITTAYGVFALMKNPDTRADFFRFQEAELANAGRSDMRLLAKSLPVDQMMEAIIAGDLDKRSKAEEAEKAFTGRFTDAGLAKFAGRRVAEGGDQLIEEYMAILQMMLQDMNK